MVELEADTQIPIQSRDDMKHTDSHGRVGWRHKSEVRINVCFSHSHIFSVMSGRFIC